MFWPTFLLARLLRLGLLLLGITLLTFIITHALPVDPVVANVGQRASSNPTIVAAFRKRWGLDRPPYEQYVRYLSNLVRGDWGQSITTHRPVLTDLAQYLPATIELSTVALGLSLLFGLPLGILSALKQGRFLDHFARLISQVGVSVPVFWLGVVALYVFYFRLRWLPGPGRLGVGLAAPAGPTGFLLVDSVLAGNHVVFWDALSHLLLPATVLASYVTGLLMRVTRAGVLDVLQQNFVQTARSKGLTERRVVGHHVLKNAMGAPLTLLGLAYGQLLSGAVLTETIFAWPGIGRYAFHAAVKLDVPAIMGIALVIAMSYALLNLIVDVLYTVLDPRIRLSG